MNITPSERKALEAARKVRELTPDQLQAIPHDSLTWTPAQRRLVREHALAVAAEAFDRRRRNNEMYRHALATGNRWEIHHYRITALDTPTTTIRRALVEAHRRLLELDAMPLFANLPRIPKRLLRTV